MHIISLGSNCYPVTYIRAVLKSMNETKETHLFDTIGTSMWSINQLIEDRFEGIVDHHLFKDVVHREGDGAIVTNTRYNLRFKHDLDTVTHSRSPSFQAKVNRRIPRLEGIFRSAKQLLLIRYQEIQTRRIQHGPITDERAELYRFTTLLRSHYHQQNYVIVYITGDPNEWDETHRILSVHTDELDSSYEGCADRLSTLISPHLPFLRSKLDLGRITSDVKV